jgi:hypothetical protein
MGAVEDAKYQMEKMRRGKDESIESFARRLYYMQMEVYSANAGRDLDMAFELLPIDSQEIWIKSAREHYDKIR